MGIDDFRLPIADLRSHSVSVRSAVAADNGQPAGFFNRKSAIENRK